MRRNNFTFTLISELEGTMRSIRVILALALVILVSVPARRAQGQAKKSDADATAIQQFVDGYIGDFNRHDAHAVASRFIEDGDYVNGGGILSHGQKDIEEHFVPLFAGPLGSATREHVTVKNVRFLAPDIASLDIYYDLTGTKASDGTANPPRPGLYAATLVKQKGQWLVAVLHEIGLGEGARR